MLPVIPWRIGVYGNTRLSLAAVGDELGPLSKHFHTTLIEQEGVVRLVDVEFGREKSGEMAITGILLRRGQG